MRSNSWQKLFKVVRPFTCLVSTMFKCKNINTGTGILLFLLFGQLLGQEIDIKTKIEELKHKEPKVRLQAIISLGKIQSDEIVQALIGAYKIEKDNYLKIQIIETLTLQQSTTAVEGIISALNDTNLYVRQQAVISLGYIGDDEKIARTLSTLFDKEKNESVKLSIINTLGQQRNRVAVEGIAKALDKKNDKRIRLFAVVELEKIATEDAFKELEKIKNDTDLEIKERVNKILSKKRDKIRPKISP